MKKISILMALLAAFALTFVTTGCKDGEDGESATALILNETGNKWYKYSNEDNNTVTTTASDSSGGVTLGTIYLKYSTSDKKLVVAAVGDNYYATTDKELTAGKWAASAVTLRVGGKISTYSGDPTSGKTKLSVDNWGNLSAEALITKLFE